MKYIIGSFLYLVALFCLSTFIFDPANLYYELWWLDIPMHILGGFGVACLAGAILSYKGMNVSYGRIFLAFVIVAIAWELYEYIRDIIIGQEWNGWFDTLKDLADGALGATIFFYIQKK